MEEKINACQTQAELAELERMHSLNEEERRALLERRMQIFFRIRVWREENKKLGLEPTISDSWNPQKKEKGGMANAKMYTFLEKNIVVRFVYIN